MLDSAACQKVIFQLHKQHMEAKEPISSSSECISLPATDRTCMTYVKQIILFFFALKSVCNTPAACRQVAGRSNWILPHQWLRELSAPIQTCEARGGLSLKDDNRLQRKLIYFWRRKGYEFFHLPPHVHLATHLLFTIPFSCSITGQSYN